MKADIVTLYEYSVTISFTEYKSNLYKYRMRFTGKNYVPMPVDAEYLAGGFNAPPLHRIPASLVGVLRGVKTLSPSYTVRCMYFVEGNLDKAKTQVDSSIAACVEEMVRQAELVKEHWEAATKGY